MFVEMALGIVIAVQHWHQSVCLRDMMRHAHRVYQHRASWMRGDATTLPVAVSNLLCQVTSGGESKSPLGWVFAVHMCKCGYTFDLSVWSCSGIETYTPEAVVVVKAIAFFALQHNEEDANC